MASGRAENNPLGPEAPYVVRLDQAHAMIDRRLVCVETLEVDAPVHAKRIHDKVHGSDRGDQQGRRRCRDPTVRGGGLRTENRWPPKPSTSAGARSRKGSRRRPPSPWSAAI